MKKTNIDRIYIDFFYLISERDKYFYISDKSKQYYNLFIKSFESRYNISDFSDFIKKTPLLNPEDTANKMNDFYNDEIDIYLFITSSNKDLEKLKIIFSNVKSYLFYGKLFFELYNIHYNIINEIIPNLPKTNDALNYLIDKNLLYDKKTIDKKIKYLSILNNFKNNFKYDINGIVQFAANNMKSYPIDYGVIKIYPIDKINDIIEVNFVEEKNGLIIMFIKSTKDIKRSSFYILDIINNAITHKLDEIYDLPSNIRVFNEIKNLPIACEDLANPNKYKIIIDVEWKE